MGTAIKTQIFIIDDHPIVREGLAQLINQEADLVVAGAAATAAEAMQGIAKIKPDLVTVDISLQGTSGIELTRNIVAKYPAMPVLIISMYDEALHVERAFRAGARGYLTKQEATDHIVVAIRKILGGDIYVSDKWRDKLARRFISGSTSKGPAAGMLTDRELEVLQLIGQGYATQKIAGALYVSAKTIDSHYANIKNKLDLQNSHELIQFAVKWNLCEK